MSRPAPTLHELVEHVKAHALKHYEDGGWDVVVEAWEDAEIAEHLAVSGARSRRAALAAFRPAVSVWADRQADAEYHRRAAG